MTEYWLIPIAFLTSTLSGFTGLGGGALLIGAMGLFFTPTLLIPMHGVIQLSSNVSRAGLSIRDLRRDIVGRYLIGALLGGAIGLKVVVALPEEVLWLCLGGFLLAVTWVPFPKQMPSLPFKYVILGGVSTFLSLFVGISGPLVHPVILRERLEKYSFIATEASCAGITHLIKIIIFSFSGIVIISQWKLLLPMSIASILGSYAGKKILGRVKQEIFVWILKVLITVLGIKMISRAFF